MPVESKNTSLNQIAGGLKNLVANYKVEGEAHTNLDYGGGKYDKGSDYLYSHGIQNFIYDPYNRDAELNEATLVYGRKTGFTTATCLNVLNVIPTKSERLEVVRNLLNLTKGTIIISVYEGDRSGELKRTTKGWQNNQRLYFYAAEIDNSFDFIHLEYSSKYIRFNKI